MKRTTSVLLALLMLFFADFAVARAVVSALTGSAQAQRGSAAARPLRQGDEVNQGDTVSTGPNSSVVLKFDDGQVAALTSNSRMTVTAYEYNAQSGTGNVLLSLIDGGMRAVTGLIGRSNPARVSYRAATATVGIRGTDVTIVTSRGNVVVTVTEGEISFTFNGRTVNVPAGEGVNARTDGTFRQDAIQAILGQLTPQEQQEIGGLQSLTVAINQAAAGITGTLNSPSLTTPVPGGGSTPAVSPN